MKPAAEVVAVAAQQRRVDIELVAQQQIDLGAEPGRASRRSRTAHGAGGRVERVVGLRTPEVVPVEGRGQGRQRPQHDAELSVDRVLATAIASIQP